MLSMPLDHKEYILATDRNSLNKYFDFLNVVKLAKYAHMLHSCSFGLRYVSWYKYLIVSLFFPTSFFLEWESFSDCTFS